MPGIELDKFSVFKAPVQAKQLGELVIANSHWLQNSVYSGASHRYGRSYAHTLWHVSRLAVASTKGPAHLFILGYETSTSMPLRTAGAGTILQGQEVEHPQEGIIAGTDVDYWLAEEFDSDLDIHDKVARQLVHEAIRLGKVRGDRQGSTVFGTTIPGADHQPVGLKNYLLHEAGYPAVLTVPEDANTSDQLGLLKNGQILQLHTTAY